MITKQERLIEAVKKDDIKTVLYLIKPDVPNRLAEDFIDICTFRDERGYTVFHIIAEQKKWQLMEKIFALYPSINYCTILNFLAPDRTTPLTWLAFRANAWLAESYTININNLIGKLVAEECPRLILGLLQSYNNTVKYFSSTKQSILKLAFKCDDVELLRAVLRIYRPCANELQPTPGSKSEKLLNYKPARRETERNRYAPLKDYITMEKVDDNSIHALLDDEENTTDEESSDDEDDQFQFCQPEPTGSNIHYLTRGVHFSPRFFNLKQRKEAQKKEFHQRPVYSNGTRALAEKLPRKNAGNLDYELADQLVRNYFMLLKLTPDREERDAAGKKIHRQANGFPLTFTSLYDRLLQAYINSYNALFAEGGMVRNFNFCNNENPFLSTAPSIRSETGEYYVEGKVMGVDPSVHYQPRIRKSTGKYKHRRIGYVQIYAFDDAYFQKYATKLDEERVRGANVRKKLGEFIFESSVPEKYILGYQVISLNKIVDQLDRCNRIVAELLQRSIAKSVSDGTAASTIIISEDNIPPAISKLIKQMSQVSLLPAMPPQVTASTTHTAAHSTLSSLFNVAQPTGVPLPYSLPLPTKLPLPLSPYFNFQMVAGNGDCFFQAVAFYVNQDVKTLRTQVAGYIQNHLGEFRDLLTPDLLAGRTVETYLQNLKDGNEWADHLEIEVLMRILKRPIVIVGPDGTIRNQTEINRFSGAEPIFVYYNGRNHYDGLILKHTDANRTKDILANLQRQEVVTTTISPVTQFNAPATAAALVQVAKRSGSPLHSNVSGTSTAVVFSESLSIPPAPSNPGP